MITTATFFINLIGGGGQALWFTGDIAIWLWLTVLFANFAEAIAEGRGKAQADTLRAMRTTTLATRRRDDGGTEQVPAPELQRGDVVVVEAGRADPRRRRRDRGHRLGGRVGHHRRVGARHPRVGRRPLGRHRRHPAALRPARRAGHAGAGQVVPRPHDLAGRGRRPAQDAQRDRAQHPARRPDPDLPGRRGHAAAVRAVREERRLDDRADLPAGRADPDHHRRAALVHRHRRHGPAGAPQRARPVGPRGRGLGRHRRAAARQDRHHHARQPRGGRVHPRPGRRAARPGRGRPALVAGRRDARGPLDRRPGQAVRRARARAVDDRGRVRALLGHHPHERRQHERQRHPQGRDRRRAAVRRGERRPGAGRGRRGRRAHRPRRAARRWSSPATTARWASSTSRTSSRAASRSASTSCARWASARS